VKDPSLVIPAIVGILILGTLGLSQEVFADNISTCQDISSANTSFVLTADVASSGTCFSILNVDNVSLDCDGHIITGDGTGTGINISNSNNSDITNCTFTNFSTGITLQSSNSNLIEGNTLNQNNNGFSGEFSNNNSLNGNTANGNDSSGIVFSLSNNNSLNGNTANENGNGIVIAASNSNTLSDNIANGNVSGINLLGSFLNTLNGNTVNGNTGFGIILEISGEISLNGNTVNGNGAKGITLQGSHENTLNGNSISLNGEEGIYLLLSDFNELEGNIVTENNQSGALGEITLQESSANFIMGNTVSDSTLVGVFLVSSNGNFVEGNDIQNVRTGIVVEFSNFNHIAENNSNKNLYGIALSDASLNTIIGNTANENDNDGFLIGSIGSDNSFASNEASNNGGFGFNDDSTDSGTGGTANLYNNNICLSNGSGGSDPVGLCDSTPNTPPNVSINSPADGDMFFEGDVVTFEGTANDTEDGLIDGIIEWTTNLLGGILGTGTPVQVNDFAPGIYVVTATVTDTGGLVDSDSIEIEIKEKTPQMAIEDLREDIQGLIDGGMLNHGIGNSLLSSLEAAEKSIEKGNTNSACGQLGSVLNEINAKDGNELTPIQAQEFREAVNEIELKLDC